MDRERWRLLEEHFEAALDLPADARAALLERVRAEDADLAVELASLLQANDAAEGFMAQPAEAGAAARETPADVLQAGSRVGTWRIVGLIGRGGMGEVYEAERVDAPFEQRAALKVIRHEAVGLLDRFNIERQILAQLDHPGIARLLDGGETEDGRQYAVMEFVAGLSITQYCEVNRADLRARLALVLQVCDAVAHAHRNLIVHRDLKPGNVIVDVEGRTRLLDFGIAKPLDARVGGISATETTALLLTPEYAAPEQLAGEPVTTATDVYALGVLLFELLTGQKPWSIEGKPFGRALQSLLERPAPRISQVTANAADSPVPSRSLRGDLDAIVAKCLRQEPQSRYVTVEALREDLSRFLDGRPVQARAGSRRYRVTRFIKRYRLPVAAGALVLLAIIGGSAAAFWQARVAREESHRAEAVQDFLISIFRANTENQSDPVKARNTTARELLAAGAERLEADKTLPAAARDQLLDVIAQLYTEMDLRETAASLTEQRIAHLRQQGDQKELARALVSFADNVLETNRRAEALPALREAERLVLAQRPIDDTMAGTVYSYLSHQLTLEDPPAARRYADEAVSHLRRASPNSVEMLGALFMLTEAYRVTDPVKAERGAREALQVVKNLHGEGHAMYGNAALLLADIQATLFKNAEADPYFRVAETIALRSTERHNYLRLQVDLRYGLFLIDTGHPDQGLQRLQRAQNEAIESRGTDDRVYTAWSNEYLARAHFQRGALQRAQEFANANMVSRRTIEPNDLLAKGAELLFDIKMAAGDVAGAIPLIKEARAARELVGSAKELGFEQGLLVREAELALAQGEAARAVSLYDEVLKAKVPPVLQFQRYWLGAWVGRSRASLALNQPDRAARDAQAALDEVSKLGAPIQLRLVEADAWQQLGTALALAGDCGKAGDAWSRGLASLTPVSQSDSFRFGTLQAARDAACKETSRPT